MGCTALSQIANTCSATDPMPARCTGAMVQEPKALHGCLGATGTAIAIESLTGRSDKEVVLVLTTGLLS